MVLFILLEYPKNYSVLKKDSIYDVDFRLIKKITEKVYNDILNNNLDLNKFIELNSNYGSNNTSANKEAKIVDNVSDDSNSNSDFIPQEYEESLTSESLSIDSMKNANSDFSSDSL